MWLDVFWRPSVTVIYSNLASFKRPIMCQSVCKHIITTFDLTIYRLIANICCFIEHISHGLCSQSMQKFASVLPHHRSVHGAIFSTGFEIRFCWAECSQLLCKDIRLSSLHYSYVTIIYTHSIPALFLCDFGWDLISQLMCISVFPTWQSLQSCLVSGRHYFIFGMNNWNMSHAACSGPIYLTYMNVKCPSRSVLLT